MPELHPLVWGLIIGFCAGFLANLAAGNQGGLIRNVVVGILGAILATWLLPALGVPLHLIGTGVLNSILVAATCAFIILLLARFLVRG